LIGDSAYYIFRPDGQTFNLIYESQDQLHGFNFPFQIGSKGDDPRVAIPKTHKGLQNDDLIIAVTDGVSDNLFTRQIINILEQLQGMDLINDPQMIADKIAK